MAGIPHIINWQKVSLNKPLSKELKSPSVVPKMFPITLENEERLERKIREFENKGYAIRGNPIFKPDNNFDWGSNPKQDTNWHFKINSWDMFVPYFQIYEQTLERRWLEVPLEEAIDWINFNLIQNNSNDFKWYDMATGLRAVQIAILFSSLDETISLDTKRLLFYAAQVHIQVLKRQDLLSEGNHELFQLVGLASLCKSLPFISECSGISTFLDENFSALMNKQLSVEGIHLEHSSQYHPWAVKVLTNIQQLDLFDNTYFERLGLAKENAKWFFQPDGKSGLIGDSERKDVGIYRNLSSSMQYLYHNEKGEKPTDNLAIFKEAGFSFYRSSWDSDSLVDTSYIIASAAYHSRVHKQHDDLTFEWFEKGQPIISDSGKYSYDDSELTKFFRSRFAHNTVTVGDEVDWFKTQKPYGSSLIDGGELDDFVWMEFDLYRKDVSTRHQRLLVLKPGHWLLVLDRLEGEKSQNFTQWFHFDPGFNIDESDNGYQLSNDADSLTVSLKSSSDRHVTYSYYRGQKAPFLMGWISEKYKELNERVSVGITSEGEDSIFATLLTIDSLSNDFDGFDQENNTFSICWNSTLGLQGVIYSPKEGRLERCR